jgi:hypothetical protein
MHLLDLSIPNAIARLKADYVKLCSGRTFLTEVLPLARTPALPIDSSSLKSLHSFADANEIYTGFHDRNIGTVACRVYEADINRFWLSSKKHDSCYQPFYPTWLLSAFALAHGAKLLGFNELVDIGSGDGRIAFCGHIMGMKSYGIEIDPELVALQEDIVKKTGVSYAVELADAVQYDYDRLGLSRPIFFVSGLPEMGEMLARSVLRKILADPKLNDRSGFNFMGSHTPKRLSRDHTAWGWGEVISEFDLALNGVVTLPTYWTTEQPVDTAYVYAAMT